MNKYELQAQADELQMQLNTLSEKIANCKDAPKMFPQGGQTYWYYENNGTVRAIPAADSDGRLNAYKTKAEAQKAVKIQWAKHRVAHRIAVLNEGWVPDWEDATEKKFYISLWSNSQFAVDYSMFVKNQPDWMYCKSIKVTEQIIEECRDDLLLIFSE